jgi:formylglycine-generating enzyme required for sulfatase activity
VNWDDANAFCRRLTDAIRRGSYPYSARLPRVSEWDEVAPRTIAEIPPTAWLKAPNRKGPRPVTRSGAPGELVDLVGNVSEWMEDDADMAESGAVPGGPFPKAIRGGSYMHEMESALTRDERLPPQDPDLKVGFRIVLVPDS